MTETIIHQSEQLTDNGTSPIGDDDVRAFRSPTGATVRCVIVDGAPWFVARDIGEALQLTNVAASVALLAEYDKGLNTIDTRGGPQKMTIISEAGAYELVFRSRREEARAFTRWVTREVLPSIRRTGAYAKPGLVPSGIDPQLIVAQVTEAITALTSRLDERLTKLEQGRTMFTALPSVDVPPRTLRAELEALVDDVAHKKRCHKGTVMLQLYKEVRRRFHIDYRQIKERVHYQTGRRRAVLDFVEQDGNLPALYNLALSYFGELLQRDLHPEAIEDAVFMAAEDPLTDEERHTEKIYEFATIQSHPTKCGDFDMLGFYLPAEPDPEEPPPVRCPATTTAEGKPRWQPCSPMVGDQYCSMGSASLTAKCTN